MIRIKKEHGLLEKDQRLNMHNIKAVIMTRMEHGFQRRVHRE